MDDDYAKDVMYCLSTNNSCTYVLKRKSDIYQPEYWVPVAACTTRESALAVLRLMEM